MKYLNWTRTADDSVIEITLDLQAAQWVLDNLPKHDGATEELAKAVRDIEENKV